MPPERRKGGEAMEPNRTLDGMARPLIDWYRLHVRPLPWRENPTPYRVWVSEIMLQQTRIEAVLPYFDRFMAALPDVAALAGAEEELLLKLWEGLGYYSRVRHMQKAARMVMEEYGGRIPDRVEDLLRLPGIGDYTAGAVASIAYGRRAAAVDGNVLRVFARLTACRDDILRPAVKKELSGMVLAQIPEDAPGIFNQAVMELGETVCLPNTEPLCAACPVRPFCRGSAGGIARELPVRSPKKARRVEHRLILVVVTEEKTPRVLLRRRPGKGLLAGLWELPGLELPEASDDSRIREAAEKEAVKWGLRPASVRMLGGGRHIFSHVEWHMQGALLLLPPFDPPEGCRFVTGRELADDVALPSAFRAYTSLLPILLASEGAGGKDGKDVRVG